MPFTLAHPAAALLLRRTPLPLTAVVAGSMAPDVPVFFHAYGRPYNLTHSLVGAVTVDLAVALAALVLWVSVLRDPLVDLLPAVVRERIDPWGHLTRAEWLLAPAGAVAGSLTHITWDLFTHVDRWGVARISWLHEQHGQLLGFQWAQLGSSVVGMGICAIWALVYLRGRPRRPHPRLDPWLDSRALAVVAAVTVASALYSGVPAYRFGFGNAIAETAVFGTIAGACSVVLLAFT